MLETLQVGPPDELLPPLASIPPLLPLSMPTAATGRLGTPEWWLTRLWRELDARQAPLRLWDSYYRGTQPLAFASPKFLEAFGGRFRAFSSNYSALVVDATRERIAVEGFRLSGPRAERRAWRAWQDNDMDAGSQIAHTEALVKGCAYALVEPAPSGPRITIEDALAAITEADPRDGRKRLAGLKRWIGPDGHMVAYVYRPDGIFTFRSATPTSSASTVDPSKLERWAPPGQPWPMPNVLGTVPLVPLPNRPRLDGWGRSEVEPIMSNQDAVNKLRADAIIAAEYGAFRQRWVMGVDIPRDDNGKPVETIRAAADRLWWFGRPSPEDPRQELGSVGEFEQTDLRSYMQMIESEVGAISSISRIPYHYLLGQPQAVPPSGESLKASEAGLIGKVRTAMIHLGEGWEEVIRLCLTALGDAAGTDRTGETRWRDPETRNEAVRTDAVLKQYQAGLIPREVALAQLGYSPEQIARMTAPPAPPAIDSTEGTAAP